MSRAVAGVKIRNINNDVLQKLFYLLLNWTKTPGKSTHFLLTNCICLPVVNLWSMSQFTIKTLGYIIQIQSKRLKSFRDGFTDVELFK